MKKIIRKKDKNYLLLHEQRMYRAFIYLAFPVMGANLLKSIHDLVDTYFIGQMPNSVSAQAGISITWPLLNIFLALSSGLAIAGVAIISQYLGAKEEEHAKEYAALLITLSIGIGIVFNVLLFLFSPIVLKLMGATGGTYEAGLTYLRVRSFEMVFLFLFAAFQAIRQASGDTSTPVLFSITSIVLNIILTGVFIRILNWGIFGAAFATLISQVVVTPFCIFILFDKKDRLHISKSNFSIRIESMKHLFQIALPSALSQALSSLGFLILQAAILSYGDSVAAAFSIGNKVSNLLLIPIMALGSILAAFVGQNIGARNIERAKKAYIVSRNIAILISVVGCMMIFPVREFTLRLLTNDTKTLEIAMEYLFFVLLTQPLMAIFQNYMGVFNGSGNTNYSFMIATARLWVVRLPLILLLKNCTQLGRAGIWYAMVISNFIIIIFAKYLFKKVDFQPKVK